MATLISFSPGTTIASASVNSNYNSLNNAKVEKSGDTMTGALNVTAAITQNGQTLVLVNGANAANTPIQLLVVQTLPAIQAKGTIAIKTPFALP